MADLMKSRRHHFYDAHTRMSATPMLIHIGTADDYELGERPCDAFVATWPEAARSRTTVVNVKDGMPSPKDAAKRGSRSCSSSSAI